MKKGDLAQVKANAQVPSVATIWKWEKIHSPTHKWHWGIVGAVKHGSYVIIVDLKNPVDPDTKKTFRGFVLCFSQHGLGFIHIDYLNGKREKRR